MVLLGAMMVFYRVWPGIHLLSLPPLYSPGVARFYTGAACALAALNVKYRDFRYVVPFPCPIRRLRFAGRFFQ